MKIAWLSSRNLGSDLCSTTQIQLANRLAKKGHLVEFYSPGNIRDCFFVHHPIKRSKIRGFQARSIVKNLRKYADEINSADVALVDWPLDKISSMIKIPIILMDRSPPADSGLLSKLQWLVWSKAWSKASKGTVVSESHRNFVVEKTEMQEKSISIIPAGVDLEMFNRGTKDEPIRMVYHGRVDVNRGVLSLPMILAGLKQNGINATLHIHGEGNAIQRLRNIEIEGLEVTGAISQNEISEKLSKYDIGLLPMPVNKIWNLASPLKRSEYLASGLVVCGIQHTGHAISNSGDWLQLFKQHEFISNTVNWISNTDRKSLTELQQKSRSFAEHNLSWDYSVDVLESIILS